ncbi:ABC transporter permease subunit [Mesobaculum littorinae]|uniref:ABC transporter permease subunit n=1 Tax=Mesobaculum littorinae TaxID=2486419 RepID=A0A438AGV0_9RHOB|nr:ABC transporter permease subunit [Mesobaculum littorinae]RVV97914.1 ABC transporter permease subunit [Mesobaculum littorinae]
MLGIGLMGVEEESMVTLAIVPTCVIFCSQIAVPPGILPNRTGKVWGARLLLDLMQRLPPFVYLVPIVMVFSVGNISGMIATFIHALPPVARLTNLGIHQVRPDMVEAARAFGTSHRQRLCKVEIPLAMPTIMAGVNRTIMMAPSMVVVAWITSVTGLGHMVLRGRGGLDMGLVTVGGLGILVLAVVIDRLSQFPGTSSRDRVHKKWYLTGPVGRARSMARKG